MHPCEGQVAPGKETDHVCMHPASLIARELQTLRLMTGRLQASCLPSPEEGQGWSRWNFDET